jgi:hypothetical protein
LFFLFRAVARLSQTFPNADFAEITKLATDLTKVNKECCHGDLLECADDRVRKESLHAQLSACVWLHRRTPRAGGVAGILPSSPWLLPLSRKKDQNKQTNKQTNKQKTPPKNPKNKTTNSKCFRNYSMTRNSFLQSHFEKALMEENKP